MTSPDQLALASDDAAPPHAGAPAGDDALPPAVAAQAEEGQSPATTEAARDPLDDLHTRREKIDAELGRLGVFAQRRVTAEGRLAEIDGAIKAIDADDRAHVENWAASADPALPAPKPRLDERRQLLAFRLDVEAELQAAAAGALAVETQRQRLIAERQQLAFYALERRLDETLAAARSLHESSLEIMAELSAPLSKLTGLRAALAGLASRFANVGDAARHRAVSATLAEIAKLTPPPIYFNQKLAAAAEQEWAAKLG